MSAAELYILRQGSSSSGTTFEQIDPAKESWDRLSNLVVSRPGDLVRAGYTATSSYTGPWYPMRVTTSRSVELRPLVKGRDDRDGLTGSDLAAARVSYVNWLASPAGGKAPAEAALVQAGDTINSQIIVRNVFINAGTLLALATMVFSLGGMPRYFRVWRANRRLRNNTCGLCRYDLSATGVGAEGLRCPECGALWPPEFLAQRKTAG